MSKWYDLDIMREHHKNKWAQDGEDGLLVHIFSNIEPRCKFGVEFGAGGSHGTQNLKWLKYANTCVIFDAPQGQKGIQNKYAFYLCCGLAENRVLGSDASIGHFCVVTRCSDAQRGLRHV